MLLTFRNNTVIVEVSQDSPFVRQSRVAVKTNFGRRIHKKKQSSRTKACSNASHFVNHKSNMDWPKPEPKPTGYEPYAMARPVQVWIRTKHIDVGPRGKRLKTTLCFGKTAECEALWKTGTGRVDKLHSVHVTASGTVPDV